MCIRDSACFVPLDTQNHLLLEQEPAWPAFFAELEGFLGSPAPVAAKKPVLAGLTRREQEVLDLVARGLGNEAIAGRLGMTEKTVRNHVSAILSKLGVASRSQAIVHARENGFGNRDAR